MSKLYSQPYILTENLGNNSFAWDERTSRYGHSPTLTIPSLIDGTLHDVIIGEDIVFEEIEDRVLRSCSGLANFVSMDLSYDLMILPVTVFDNHNHALYFWIDAVREGRIKPRFELIHIDEHSDLWNNTHTLDLTKSIQDEQYAWDFTNLSCNVGNYIVPALESGLVGSMIRIENEYQIDKYMDYRPSENSVLNLDLDIFAPELDHIPDTKKIAIIQKLMKQVKYVTIATSPYFIEQGVALEKLHQILRT